MAFLLGVNLAFGRPLFVSLLLFALICCLSSTPIRLWMRIEVPNAVVKEAAAARRTTQSVRELVQDFAQDLPRRRSLGSWGSEVKARVAIHLRESAYQVR